MQRKQEKTIVESDELELFSYVYNGNKIFLAIASCQKNIHRRDCMPQYKGYTIDHSVNFLFCGLRCNNSYRMLSIVHSLTTVFTKRKLGQGASKMSVKIPQSIGISGYLFSKSVTNTYGYEMLELGFVYTVDGAERTKSCVMHIAYVYDLQNALVKAMGWVAPEQTITQTIIS